MVKKVAKKIPIKKKKVIVKRKIPQKPVKKIVKPLLKPKPVVKTAQRVDKKLMENFVALQKVLVNLSVKFDSLSTQISKLLELFEISAKSLAQKDFEPAGTKETKEIKDKLDNLFEQNKLIARGLTLMHDKVDVIPPPPMQPQPQPQPQPMPRQFYPQRTQAPPQQMQPQPQPMQPPQHSENAPPIPSDMQGYEKSLTSQAPPQGFKKLRKSPGGLKTLKDNI